jgi:exonuclease VII large subunit
MVFMRCDNEGAISQIFAEKTQRLEYLQMRILLRKRLQTLQACLKRVSTLEITLQQFADQYFDAVGDYAAQLQHLHSRLPPHRANALPHTSLDMLAQWQACNSNMAAQNSARKAMLKASYHKLARQFHPDQSEHMPAKSAAIMQQINAAYQAKDMGALLQLEIEYLHDGRDDMDALADKIARCETLIGACNIEQTHLENSPIFALHERHMLARLAGENFISNVIGNLKIAIRKEAGNWQITRFQSAA